MNKKLTAIILSVSILIVGAYCSSKNVTPKVDPGQMAVKLIDTVRLADKDNGGNVKLKIGQNLILDLAANPSTGYRWEITGHDEKILPLISRDYKQREAEPGMVGVGGTLTCVFKAIAAGKTNLKLIYTRPQSGADDIANNFSVNVEVK